MFQAMKDKALSKGAQMAINTQIEAYGKVQSLHLDSQKKNIELSVLLEGESEVLKVHVSKYDFTEIDGKHQLRIQGITTSRAWINTIASAYLEGKAFNIPNEYAKMFKVVI